MQISRQVLRLNPADLRLSSRAWKVKLIGERADDAGGAYDDLIVDMVDELQSGIVSLLIPTPNAVNREGFNRDR